MRRQASIFENIPLALSWARRAVPYYGARTWWLAKAKPLGAFGAFVVFALLVIAIALNVLDRHQKKRRRK